MREGAHQPLSRHTRSDCPVEHQEQDSVPPEYQMLHDRLTAALGLVRNLMGLPQLKWDDDDEGQTLRVSDFPSAFLDHFGIQSKQQDESPEAKHHAALQAELEAAHQGRKEALAGLKGMYKRLMQSQEQLRLARKALYDTGYFKTGQIGADIAPHITEFANGTSRKLEDVLTLAHRAIATGADEGVDPHALLEVLWGKRANEEGSA